MQNEPAPIASAEDSGMGTWMYVVFLLLAAAIFGAGIYLAVSHQGFAMLAAGAASVVAVLVTWPLAVAMAQGRAAEARLQQELSNTLTERLQQIAVLLNVISEQQTLSDRAKQVAFRDKDRDALRRAIKEDLARRDFEAALVLVDEMERMFGYRQEAAAFRQEINNFRQEVLRREIVSATQQIDTFCRQEKWSEALREAERLMNIYAGNEQVQKLPAEIEARRQGTKRQLLDAFNEAVARKDVDGGIEILKKLDMYLTHQEAEQLQEAARNVFKEKLNQLGAQFTLAVQDRKDAEAVRVGEIIIRDFPNSGIAREVRDILPKIRARNPEGELARA
jgi:hypothetical protein